MGRIKTKVIKRATQKMMEQNADAFSGDFAKNKEAVRRFLNIKSQKLENIVAGYATKLVKLRKNEK